MNTGVPANATFENCIFEENSATSFGGGIYFGFHGYSSYEFVINKTKFTRNRSHSAGGLFYSFVQGVGCEAVFLLTNSEFVENSAQVGGGTYTYAAGKWRSILLHRLL